MIPFCPYERPTQCPFVKECFRVSFEKSYRLSALITAITVYNRDLPKHMQFDLTPFKEQGA